jgi:sulfate adenylyltransferase subunit 2
MSNDIYLKELENKTICIIREAYWHYREKLALLWSCGKDSTTLLYLARKAFFSKIPIPVIHIDTGFKFSEIYKFRNKISQIWDFNLIVARNEEALKKEIVPQKGRFQCCNKRKTTALKKIIEKHKFKALLLAIRRDEHAIRAKERYFSPRDRNFTWDYLNQPIESWNYYYSGIKKGHHLRIHPLLHWREIDIWQYINKENIPVVHLYFAKKGLRYRSIGCKYCCKPIVSDADSIEKIIEELKKTKISERSGRVQDKEKEYMMQKLRSLGYM